MTQPPIRKWSGPPKLKKVELGEGGPSAAGWSAIETFLRCPKEFQLKHIRLIRKPEHQTPNALAVGSDFHAARSVWFAARFATDAASMARCHEAMVVAEASQQLPVSLEARRSAISLFDAYVAHYSKRPRPDPVAAEYLLGPAPLKKDDPFFLFRTAKLDDVSRYPEANMKLCIGEAKTTSVGVQDAVKQYTLHGQPLLQYLLWRMAEQGEKKHGPVAGTILDVIKKPYGREKAVFGREFIPFTEFSLGWFAESMRGYLRAAAAVEWETPTPRNPSACTRLLGRMRGECPYVMICKYGGSSSASYVMGAEGKSLKSDHGHKVQAWE